MHSKQLLAAGTFALVNAAPPPVSTLSTLSTTMSGVLPYLPISTGFTGVEIIEGAIVYDGPVVDGFTGNSHDQVPVAQSLIHVRTWWKCDYPKQ
jgi:hypothetical protein